MPVIIALTLATGRRGNAALCAAGAHTLARCAAALALLGPLLAVGSVLALLASLRGPAHMLDGISPWMPAMLPYSTSVVAWLAGIACLIGYLVADRAAAQPQPSAGQNCWQPGQVGLRVCLALLAALCFFVAQVLPNWPFSGLPQGLTMTDVVLVVLSTSVHDYFTAFAPAGSVALLVLAVLIAFLGIVNTLALSVFERTREIGLLRAVGTTRRQIRRMILVESVLIAVLGSVLGVVLGVLYGVGLQRVLADDGISELGINVGQLVLFVLVSAVGGVVAALWPAWRASKLNVLQAIATE